MLKAVIFDMDGVLVDSHDAWFELVNFLLKGLGRNQINLDTFDKDIWGIPIIDKGAEKFGIDKKEAFKILSDPKVIEMLAIKTKIFDGALLALESIKINYKLCVVTNTNRVLVETVLEHADMLNYFDAIVSTEDVKTAKPAPDGILRACELLKVKPSEAIYVGDLPVDVQAGKAAGVKTIAIEPTKGADFSVKSVKELPALLEKNFKGK